MNPDKLFDYLDGKLPPALRRMQSALVHGIEDQRSHHDCLYVALHPADGVYSALPSCTQWHSKGVYQIP